MPQNSDFNSDLVAFLRVAGLMDFFVFEHLDKQRSHYASFSESQFLSTFEISDLVYQQFVTYFIEASKLDAKALNVYKSPIKMLLKSAFSKQLFGDNSAAKVVSPIDPMLIKVMDIEAALIPN